MGMSDQMGLTQPAGPQPSQPMGGQPGGMAQPKQTPFDFQLAKKGLGKPLVPPLIPPPGGEAPAGPAFNPMEHGFDKAPPMVQPKPQAGPTPGQAAAKGPVTGMDFQPWADMASAALPHLAHLGNAFMAGTGYKPFSEPPGVCGSFRSAAAAAQPRADASSHSRKRRCCSACRRRRRSRCSARRSARGRVAQPRPFIVAARPHRESG